MDEKEDNTNKPLVYYKIVNLTIKELNLFLRKKNFKIASLEEIASLRLGENKRSKFVITKDRELLKEDSIFDYGPYLTRNSIIMLKDKNGISRIKILDSRRSPLLDIRSVYIPFQGIFIIESYKESRKNLVWKVNYDMIDKLVDYPVARFNGDMGEKIELARITFNKTLSHLMGDGDLPFLKDYGNLLVESQKDYIRIVPEQITNTKENPVIKEIFYGASNDFKGMNLYCKSLNEKERYYFVLLKEINKNN